MENASANTNTTSIENTLEDSEHVVFTPRAVLDLDAIEALRAAQHNAFNQAIDVHTSNGFSNETATFYAKNATHSVIDQYLEANGLDRNDDRYVTYQNALSQVSINAVDDKDWAATYIEGTTEQGQSGRDKVRALYADLTGEDYYANPDATESSEQQEIVDPAVEAAKEQLTALRSTLAKLSAKRQGHLFGDGGQKYQQALDAYNAQVQVVGRLEKTSIIESETLTEEEKNADIIMYLLKEQNELRKASLAEINSSKVRGFIEWMNKGNVAQRIAKGFALGAGASVAGTLIGAAAGAAGVAALGAGVAAGVVGVARFARGFAKSDAKAGHGMKEITTQDLDGTEQSFLDEGEDSFTKLHQRLTTVFENDINKEQSKRRRSAAAGLGGIALGATAGVVVGALSDSGAFDGWFGHSADAPASEGQTPESPTVGGAVEEGLDANSDGVIDTEGEVPEDPEVEVPEEAAPEAMYDPGFVIESGEGGIHFFQDIGLTEGNWYEVQNELLQKFPDEFYGYNGDVRIAHPGQLSLEAQQFIKARFGMA